MTYGAIINGTDTKTEYDLILLADVIVEAPPVKSVYIDIPGRNGAIDASEALGGRFYGNRNISFTLFGKMPDSELRVIRKHLEHRYHGKNVTLTLPDDLDHYYQGRMQIGGVSGYNTGKIKVTMTAEPEVYEVEEE